ncbi:MAG: electron transfer flavoprotein subunit beta/FixA family protein [Planctomycetota bacterium]
MRIIVPIKQVPETSAVKMDPETGTMVREGVEAIVNPLDLYAIELAIRLCEQAGDGDHETVGISMGPPKAAKALKEAISMGLSRGVLISDRRFAGADTWSTAYVLKAAIEKLGPVDLVVCGERATDGDTGQVGPGTAAFLDVPVISYVSKLEYVRDGVARVHRLVEDGYEVLDAQLPAVLTVVKEASDPRLPTLRGKQRAKAMDLPVWSVDDLDVDAAMLGLAGSPTRVVKIFRPKVARTCETLVASDEQTSAAAVRRVVAFLQQRELI